MKRKVYFSNLAATKVTLLSEYLEEKWSARVKQNFIKSLKSKIQFISEYPESCVKSDIHPELYRCIVTQTSLLYRIVDNNIEVITVLDNRRSYKSINKEIQKYYGHI